jgi:kynureninase
MTEQKTVEEMITIEELAKLTGFSTSYLKSELQIEDKFNMGQLRQKLLTLLNTTFEQE